MPDRVVYSARAANRIEAELIYLREHSAAAANRLLQRLETAKLQLTEFPQSAPRGTTPGTRRLILGPYVLTYRQIGSTIEILDFRHGRHQERPIPDEP